MVHRTLFSSNVECIMLSCNFNELDPVEIILLKTLLNHFQIHKESFVTSL